jgi:hypothetical protein
MPNRRLAVVLLTTLSACAGRVPEVAVAPPSPPQVVEAPPPPALPAGASPNMPVPAMLADGSFPTPNRALSPAAAVWHLRAGLNVAALACRTDEATTVARYNAFLAAHRAELTQAEAAYAAEFRAGGGDWRDRYDDAMTRLYNYYATPPAQAAFCAAAAELLAEAQAAPAQSIATFAAERLPALDRAFIDFYRAYDAWRRASLPPVVIASVAPTQPQAQAQPRLQLDRASLFDEGVATAR